MHSRPPVNDEVAYADAEVVIDFRTAPDRYRHWRLHCDGPVARLAMDVDAAAPMFPGYELKLNSYDIGVDIELHDAIQRLRFCHPEVKCVVLTSARDAMFCAGANIRMLGRTSHGHKVNFCKFTNETRNAIEDAGAHSGQRYLAAVNGTAAGGGYELALAADHILLVDDGNAAVSLPEVPLLAVLPGTGGLTRLVDKRRVRRDHADVLCTMEEGIKGARARDWNLVDEIAPGSQFATAVGARARALAALSDRPDAGPGVVLTPLQRTVEEDRIKYRHVALEFDRTLRAVTIRIAGPATGAPRDAAAARALGDTFWPLALLRELDDALLHLRFNEPDIGTIVLKTQGDPDRVLAHDRLLHAGADDWFLREVRLFAKRTLKRLDLTARSLFAFVEPGSCFAGLLAELVLAADRSYMLDDTPADGRPAPQLVLSALNFDGLPMCNGLSRLATRFLGTPETVTRLRAEAGRAYDARAAHDAGLVTLIPDAIDWDDELRLLLEERASYSPDALTGMEANLRCAGPETLETKIFGRLTAWQNWIFQRPNAVGDDGALRAYGTGRRPSYDNRRV